MLMVIAKYRKAGFPKEWFLTDFTMEQVEGRLENLEAELENLEAENAKLKEALRECVHQIECVMDYYPIHPIDRPKLDGALRQAMEVLGDA